MVVVFLFLKNHHLQKKIYLENSLFADAFALLAISPARLAADVAADAPRSAAADTDPAALVAPLYADLAAPDAASPARLAADVAADTPRAAVPAAIPAALDVPLYADLAAPFTADLILSSFALRFAALTSGFLAFAFEVSTAES